MDRKRVCSNLEVIQHAFGILYGIVLQSVDVESKGKCVRPAERSEIVRAVVRPTTHAPTLTANVGTDNVDRQCRPSMLARQTLTLVRVMSVVCS